MLSLTDDTIANEKRLSMCIYGVKSCIYGIGSALSRLDSVDTCKSKNRNVHHCSGRRSDVCQSNDKGLNTIRDK